MRIIGSPKYYVLRDKVPVRATLFEWAAYFEKADRQVGNDMIDGVRISTVFLGLDHRWDMSSGEPLLFETMVFGGKHDGYQVRACTWHQAEEQHERACDLIAGIVTTEA